MRGFVEMERVCVLSDGWVLSAVKGCLLSNGVVCEVMGFVC